MVTWGLVLGHLGPLPGESSHVTVCAQGCLEKVLAGVGHHMVWSQHMQRGPRPLLFAMCPWPPCRRWGLPLLSVLLPWGGGGWGARPLKGAMAPN